MKINEIEKSEFVNSIKYGKTYADIMYVLDDFKDEVEEQDGQVDISPEPQERNGKQRITFGVKMKDWERLKNHHEMDELEMTATRYVGHTMDRLRHIVSDFNWGREGRVSRISGKAYFYIEYDK